MVENLFCAILAVLVSLSFLSLVSIYGSSGCLLVYFRQFAINSHSAIPSKVCPPPIQMVRSTFGTDSLKHHLIETGCICHCMEKPTFLECNEQILRGILEFSKDYVE